MISLYIANNSKFMPYFDNYLSTLDSTHIAAFIPSKDQPRYRNRKSTLSQNILAVYNFDIRFIYILPS